MDRESQQLMDWLTVILALLGIAIGFSIGKAYGQSPLAMPAPKAVRSAVIRPVVTNTWYFAATAVDNNGMESDYSTEASTTCTNRSGMSATLAWDPSPGTNRIVNYRIYSGNASRTYINTSNAGTNLTLSLRVGTPPDPTNLVLTFTAQMAVSAAGPWTNWQSLSLTNLRTGSAYYRTLSVKASNKYTVTVQSASNPRGPWASLPNWRTLTQSAKPYVRFNSTTKWQ